jgi:hypothetical protein
MMAYNNFVNYSEDLLDESHIFIDLCTLQSHHEVQMVQGSKAIVDGVDCLIEN